MVSIEVIAILLSGISISASLFYYANELQNARVRSRETFGRSFMMCGKNLARYFAGEKLDYLVNQK